MNKLYQCRGPCGLIKPKSNFFLTPSGAKNSSKCKECHKIKNIPKVKEKIYFTKWSEVPDKNIHIIKLCEICDVEIFPVNSRHLRCSDCKSLSQKIFNSLVENKSYKKKNKKGKISHIELVLICKKLINKTCCCYCNRFFSEENPKNIDHIIPRSLNGTSNIYNIAISCKECNESKGGRSLEEWLRLCNLVSINYKNV